MKIPEYLIAGAVFAGKDCRQFAELIAGSMRGDGSDDERRDRCISMCDKAIDAAQRLMSEAAQIRQAARS